MEDLGDVYRAEVQTDAQNALESIPWLAVASALEPICCD